MIHNTQRRILNRWYILTLVFLISVFVPSMLGIDGMDGGYGISFLAGFMVMAGLIVIVVYRARAKQMDKILKGEGRLAVWRYTPEEWTRFVLADYLDEKREKKNLYIMLVVIGLIVGLLMTVVLQSPVLLMVVGGIFAITAIPAFLVPRLRFRKLRHSEAEALIAENGVIVGKMFHLWVKTGACLDQVSINHEENPAVIEFAYSMPTRTGMQEQMARVPIPEGKMDEAIRIMKHFSR